MTMECSGERTLVGLRALSRPPWEMEAGDRGRKALRPWKGEVSVAGSKAVPEGLRMSPGYS